MTRQAVPKEEDIEERNTGRRLNGKYPNASIFVNSPETSNQWPNRCHFRPPPNHFLEAGQLLLPQ